ncbi:tetratricopeptide repeat protein, partial [bacterium]|nr:tetratricopeptide repeat protein [bacterium]
FMGTSRSPGLGRHPYEADEAYKAALDLYSKKDMEEALNHIAQALKLHPYHAEYHATQGFFYLEHGARDKAAAAFAEALKHNQYEMMAHYGLGVLAYKTQDWPTAVQHFNLAHMIAPNRAETLYYLALAQRQSGQTPAALTSMQKALALYDKIPEAKKQARDARAWIADWERPKLPMPR